MDSTDHRPRREEYADQTKAAVLAAARQLFSDNGYFQTKVEQIAKMSRVSPATVYAQCGGKQGLLRSLMDGFTQSTEVDESFEGSLVGAEPAVVMVALTTGYLEITKEWGDVITVVLDVAPHDPESGAVLATAQERHDHNLMAICRHLEQMNALRDGIDASTATRIITYFYGIDGLLRAHKVLGWPLERCNEWLLARTAAEVLTAPETLAPAS
ncbi:TetR/AcrR family transcriptional regulator [Actinomycetospora sp. TBRC 11914]|uniref:TetR/AcrR family transcriptional regulator n=1 Tax=Actinomycetospora sp. TBRC 11914 TaxID=2729387 RepID=UPI00145ECF2B|nr:TetR/AcrR family transcriptional regulator [Actinomycetospora sp. TBRC 11914]NMO89341.1 TetR/AcrR family transcriptional regulator [Actinomycetospora sp. TBRC 11914]